MKTINILYSHLLTIDQSVKDLGLMYESVYLKKRYSKRVLLKLSDKMILDKNSVEAGDSSVAFMLNHCTVTINIKTKKPQSFD